MLEELLRRSETHLDKVIIITRHKKGEDPESRFLKEIVSSPCFANLPKNWHESVQVVEGDLALPNCGIHENVLEKIYGEITHIIRKLSCP